jgi:hypothetical protein
MMSLTYPMIGLGFFADKKDLPRFDLITDITQLYL